MPPGESSRRRQRRNALRILFEMDINQTSIKEVLDSKRAVGEVSPGEYTVRIVEGVDGHLRQLDGVIKKYAEGWELERMPRVDRNILRMALYELFFMEDIPTGVTIDEAVELAKEFSTVDSGKFINGVLGKVSRDREAGIVEIS